jgi:hypothetical protein
VECFLSGIIRFEVSHVIASSTISAERYAQAASLVEQAVVRLANRERVERTKKGPRNPKRTPYLVGNPPFVRFLDSIENKKDPFISFLDHEDIRGSEDAIKRILDPRKKNEVSKNLKLF